jgi:hypothetical protein
MWQDWIFSIGSWIFVAALIPAIRGTEKPPLSTSIVTGTVLVVFALTYFSLHLWIAATSTAITSACWLVLAYQRLKK